MLKRLGLQQDTPLPRQPSAPPRRRPEFSPQQGRIRCDFNGYPLNVQDKNCNRTSRKTHVWDEQDMFSEVTQHKMDQLYATNRSLSPDESVSSEDSLSIVDRHTPDELRAIPLLRSPDLLLFTPTPPQTTKTGRKYFPLKLRRAGKFILINYINVNNINLL